MSEGMAPEKLRALDTCIERLLAGKDWHAALPDDQSRAEILALMEVAEWLVESAGRTPRPPEHVRRRVWDRVARVLDRFTAALGGASRLNTATEPPTVGVRPNLAVGGGYGRHGPHGGTTPPGAALPAWQAVPITIVEQHSQRGYIPMFQFIASIRDRLALRRVHAEERAADAFEYLLVIGVVVVAVIAAVASGFPGGLINTVITEVTNAITGLFTP